MGVSCLFPGQGSPQGGTRGAKVSQNPLKPSRNQSKLSYSSLDCGGELWKQEQMRNYHISAIFHEILIVNA